MLTTFFEDITDFRRPQGQKYGLSTLFAFSTLAVLCNAKSYRDIHRFVSTHFDELKSDFGLSWKGPPAYTTIRNAIIGVDRNELEAAFRAFTQSLLHYWPTHSPSAPGTSAVPLPVAPIVIAVDGKTLRGSYDRFKDQPPLHQLFFYDQQQKLILGHLDTDCKSSEMKAAQDLMGDLALPGALFTLDALHCQKKTVAQAAASGHGLLVQVKNNQQQLCTDLRRLAEVTPPSQTIQVALQAGHGRLASRSVSVWRDKELITKAVLDADWQQAIETVIRVDRRYEHYDTRKKAYRTCSETAWHICNRSLTGQQAHDYVLNHWGIENTNNYVRDVSLTEDASRIRVNPGNMSVLRSTALNIIRYNKAPNVREELYLNSLNWRRTYRYKHCI
jgi:predicted transposase YbfD/YdcC